MNRSADTSQQEYLDLNNPTAPTAPSTTGAQVTSVEAMQKRARRKSRLFHTGVAVLILFILGMIGGGVFFVSQKYGRTIEGSEFPVISSLSLDNGSGKGSTAGPSELAINGDVQIAGNLSLSPQAISNLGNTLTNKISLQSTFPGSPQAGNGNITGTFGAGAFVGNGAQLTALNASTLTTGTVNDARLSDNVTRLGQTISLASLQGNVVSSINGLVNNGGNIDVVGGNNVTVSASGTSIVINALAAGGGGGIQTVNVGSGLTGGGSTSTISIDLDGAVATLQGNTFNGANQLVQLNGSGALPSLNGSLLTNLNASALSTGTVNDARLSSNVALKSGANVFTGTNSFTQTLAVTTLTPGSSILYQLDSAVAAGTYDLCSTAGNCSSVGGGVITPGGTTNKIAKFTASQTLADSSITDTGALVTVGAAALFQPASDSTNIFKIARASGASLLVADSTNSRVAINQSTANYTLDVNGDINSTTNIRIGGVAVCGTSGCVAASGNNNYIQNSTSLQTSANFNIQTTSAASVVGILQAVTGQTADIFQAKDSNNVVIAKIDATGNFTAVSLTGTGAGITALNASNVASGTLADARLSANVTLQGNTFNGPSQLVQTTAGGALPALSGVNLTGLNGSNIASGTVADIRLSANVTLQGNTFNGVSQLVQTTVGGSLPALSGANLTSLNASNVSSGTLADGRLSTNVDLLNANQTLTGSKTFQNASNSTASFQIQNAAGTSNLFIADTTNTRIGIGKTSPAYTLDVNGDINSSTNIRVGGVAICTVSGCVASGGSTNYIQNSTSQQSAANLNIESASTGAITAVFKAVAGQSVDIINVKDQSNNVVASVGNAGKTVFKTTTNDLNGFQVQNSASQSIFNVDTTNTQLSFNAAANGELKNWTTLANAPTLPRSGAGSVVVNGYVYMLGGVDGSGTTTTTVQYAQLNSDGTTKAWTTTTVLPAISSYVGAVTNNGYIYVARNGSRDIFYTRPNADGTITSWTTLTNAFPNTATTLFQDFNVANGFMYATGSGSRDIYYAKFNADGTLGTFSTASNIIPAARTLRSSVISGGYLVIMGGEATAVQTSVYTFLLNPTTGLPGAATTTTSLPAGRQASSAFTMNGYIYYVGGCADGTCTTSSNTIFYGKLTSTGTIASWSTATTTLGSTLHLTSSVVVNGVVYFISGVKGSTGTAATTATVTTMTGAKVLVTGSLDLIGMGSNGYSNGSAGSGTGGSVYAGKIVATGGLDVNGNTVLNGDLSVTGTTTISSAVNSTSAFLIQNSTSQPVFNVDTTNRRIGVNIAVATAALDVRPSAVGDIGLYIRQFASSTADLLQLQNSSGLTTFAIDASGAIANGDAFGGPPVFGVDPSSGGVPGEYSNAATGSALRPFVNSGNLWFDSGAVYTADLAQTGIYRCYHPGGIATGGANTNQHWYVYADNATPGNNNTNGRRCVVTAVSGSNPPVFNARYPYVTLATATVNGSAISGLPVDKRFFLGGKLTYVSTTSQVFPGQIVINDTAADNSVALTTSAASTGVTGLIVAGNSAAGQAIMMYAGMAYATSTAGAQSRGACVQTSTTSGSVQVTNTPASGTCLGQGLFSTSGAIGNLVRIAPY